MPLLADASGWFTLHLPEGWESSTADAVTTLRSPGGVGTLFVSGGRHSGGPQESFGRADFLGRFLRSLGLDVDDDSIACLPGVGCRIYSYVRDTAREHWCYWSITDDETALLLSYTCGRADVGREAAEVEGIVRSVRLCRSGYVH
jgi:hypothetical protein